MMGHYKSTAYVGPNSQDATDTSAVPDAQDRPYIGRWPDLPTCLVCQAQAPEGYLWIEGICSECRRLAEETWHEMEQGEISPVAAEHRLARRTAWPGYVR